MRRRSWPVWIKRASGLRYWLAWGADFAGLLEQAACLASVVALPSSDSRDRWSASPQTPSPTQITANTPLRRIPGVLAGVMASVLANIICHTTIICR